MAIEIVDLPIENGGFFHSFLHVNVYQRVNITLMGNQWIWDLWVPTFSDKHDKPSRCK